MQGLLSLSRKGGQVSALLQNGNDAPVAIGGLSAVSGPVRLGLQILYGNNYSVGISNISIGYDSDFIITWPPPSPPSPPPPPPPPPPPICAATPASANVSYAGGYRPMGVGGGGAMSSFSMSPYNDLWFVGTDMGEGLGFRGWWQLQRARDAVAVWLRLWHGGGPSVRAYQAGLSLVWPHHRCTARGDPCTPPDLRLLASAGSHHTLTRPWPLQAPSIAPPMPARPGSRSLNPR